MAESMAREALKKGMKVWLVASERVRTKVAELREDLEDVVVEARQEYESQADTDDRPPAESKSRSAPPAKPQARRAQAKREESAKAAGDPKKAKA
jgi:hypothetical protein